MIRGSQARERGLEASAEQLSGQANVQRRQRGQIDAPRWRCGISSWADESDGAKEAVIGAEGASPRPIDSGSKIEGVGIASAAAIAECQAPKAFKRQRIAVGICEIALEPAGVQIEGVDLAVAQAKAADEQRAAELAEPGRSKGQAPRRVDAARHDSPQK